MTVWSEIFLGVIAVATLAMAIVLVGVLVAASRLARRVGRILDQLELELKPLFVHLNAIGRDASRAAALATAQVERVDRVFTEHAKPPCLQPLGHRPRPGYSHRCSSQVTRGMTTHVISDTIRSVYHPPFAAPALSGF